MWVAELNITFPGTTSFDTRDDIVETVRGSAYPSLNDRNLYIRWEEKNEWDLRGLVESTIEEIEYAFTFEVEDILDKVVRTQK